MYLVKHDFETINSIIDNYIMGRQRIGNICSVLFSKFFFHKLCWSIFRVADL